MANPNPDRATGSQRPHTVVYALRLPDNVPNRPLTPSALLEVHRLLLPAIDAAAHAYHDLDASQLRAQYVMAAYDFDTERTTQSWFNMLVLGACMLQRSLTAPVEPSPR